MRSTRDILATTLASGGGTFDPATLDDITYGYAVGCYSGDFDYADFSGRYLRSAINAARKYIRSIPFLPSDIIRAVGTWIDGNRIVIDPVLVLDSEYKARAMAVRFNQRAYYILHEHREVQL